MDKWTLQEEAFKRGYEKGKADAVVHGRWEWYEVLVNPYALCSNCGCGLDKRDALNFVYCPYCGAKMDGGNEDV